MMTMPRSGSKAVISPKVFMNVKWRVIFSTQIDCLWTRFSPEISLPQLSAKSLRRHLKHLKLFLDMYTCFQSKPNSLETNSNHFHWRPAYRVIKTLYPLELASSNEKLMIVFSKTYINIIWRISTYAIDCCSRILKKSRFLFILYISRSFLKIGQKLENVQIFFEIHRNHHWRFRSIILMKNTQVSCLDFR